MQHVYDRYLLTLVAIEQRLLSSYTINCCYTHILEDLGKTLQVSRVYLLEVQNSEDQLLQRQIAEWNAVGVQPLIHSLLAESPPPSNTIADSWLEILRQGGMISKTASDFSASEQEMLTARQALAVLVCPLGVGEKFYGAIGLEDCLDARFWEPAEVALLQGVATALSFKLEQLQTQSELQRLHQQVQQLHHALEEVSQKHSAQQIQVQELEQLNYLKDDFLNTVSHELRSPMANIEMAIQMLELLVFKNPQPTISHQAASHDTQAPKNASDHLNRHDTDHLTAFFPAAPHPLEVQRAFRYFRMLQDECVRETNLINDLLNLSRLEAGTEPLVLTTIDLYSWIPHVIEPFLERACKQHQALQVEIPSGLPRLTTDLFSLERIFSELLHNACKYTPAGELIQVTAFLHADVAPESATHRDSALLPDPVKSSNIPSSCNSRAMLFLQVSNSGIEISPAELLRIFDKFYRIPSHDPWKHEGTGLGLALVKKLVQHLGGSIQATSRRQRVTFTIALPIDRNQ